ncbi:MAG TPA: tetratricopeptide repeat protein [Parvibaculum sp.]
MTDLFREIEEDLRRDQVKQLWEKYGIYVVGLAAAIVLVAAIVVGWRSYQLSKSEAASARYDAIVAAAAKQKPEETARQFGDFATTAPSGYAALAKLRQAAALLDAGDRKGAVAVYDSIAGSSDGTAIMRDMARIKAGILLVDTASYDEMKKRMEPVLGADDPWRHNAHELVGLAAWKAGKYVEAEKEFDAIVNDPQASAGLRDRAHVMQALIAPHLPAPADNAAKATGAAPLAAGANKAGAADAAAGKKPE